MEDNSCELYLRSVKGPVKVTESNRYTKFYYSSVQRGKKQQANVELLDSVRSFYTYSLNILAQNNNGHVTSEHV